MCVQLCMRDDVVVCGGPEFGFWGGQRLRGWVGVRSWASGVGGVLIRGRGAGLGRRGWGMNG